MCARDGQTAAVTASLVDETCVAAWMDTQALAPGAPITVTRITTGHSNEVFRIERGDLVAILRRPPRTPLSPTAHDMAREFRVLAPDFRGHGRGLTPWCGSATLSRVLKPALVGRGGGPARPVRRPAVARQTINLGA